MSGQVNSCTCNADHAEDKCASLEPSQTPELTARRRYGAVRWPPQMRSKPTKHSNNQYGASALSGPDPPLFQVPIQRVMGSALVSLLGTDDLADFILLPSPPNGSLGRKHSRSWGRTQLQNMESYSSCSSHTTLN